MIQKQINRADEIVSLLIKSQSKHSVFIVAIDGRGGSGKSTLAKSIQLAIPCQIINTDDYFDFNNLGVDSYYWDKQSFAADILTPLRNKDTGTYQKNLWIDGKFTGIKESFSVKPNGMIIIEGLMSLQKDLIDFYDETIWIDLDQIQALQQAKDRDINQKGWDSTEVEKNWKEWLLVQELYIKKEEPDKTSSIIFTNKN